MVANKSLKKAEPTHLNQVTCITYLECSRKVILICLRGRGTDLRKWYCYEGMKRRNRGSSGPLGEVGIRSLFN